MAADPPGHPPGEGGLGEPGRAGGEGLNAEGATEAANEHQPERGGAAAPADQAAARRQPDPAGATNQGTGTMPARIFWLELFYLVVLAIIFFVYKTSSGFAADFPAKLGPLPIATIWFGALGGVIIGLQGVFVHNRDWDDSYTYWHYARPLVGAVSGGVGCLILYVLITIGSSKSAGTDATTFEAVAFALGMADDAFRRLIHKLVTTVIAPGTSSISSGKKKD
jgi:hypothetical protein